MIGRAALALVLAAPVAHAGGLTLPAQGVRSLARGGAMIAGAEDADALWSNPAGLATLAKPVEADAAIAVSGGNGGKKAKRPTQALLFEGALVYQTVDHTRVDASGMPLGQATNDQPGTLVPALAGALRIGDRLVIAGGLSSPYASFPRFADDGAQRYAGVGESDSAIVVIGAGIGYRVNDQLRVGATVQNWVARQRLDVVASACPPAATCAPEDRTFDMPLAIDETAAVAPSGSVGLQYDAGAFTYGLAIQAPVRLSGTGTLAVTLPSSPTFTAATVSGDKVALKETLPGSIRGGVQWHSRSLRVEAAIDVEPWSLHHQLTIQPDGVAIDGPGGGTPLVNLAIARDYATTFSPAVAFEWHGPLVMLGGAVAYETAAAPAATVSVLAPGGNRMLLSIGGGYEDGGWQIGAAAALVVISDVDVAPDSARVDQLTTLGGTGELGVNAGSYRSRQLVAGLRLARRW